MNINKRQEALLSSKVNLDFLGEFSIFYDYSDVPSIFPFGSDLFIDTNSDGETLSIKNVLSYILGEEEGTKRYRDLIENTEGRKSAIVIDNLSIDSNNLRTDEPSDDYSVMFYSTGNHFNITLQKDGVDLCRYFISINNLYSFSSMILDNGDVKDKVLLFDYDNRTTLSTNFDSLSTLLGKKHPYTMFGYVMDDDYNQVSEFSISGDSENGVRSITDELGLLLRGYNESSYLEKLGLL